MNSYDEDGYEYEDYIEEGADQTLESIYDDSDSQEDEVLFEAVQRIEEANLYKLLIKSDVFDAGSAAPAILDAVNLKIRNFALSELQRLLGMDTETTKNGSFDKEEVTALKIIAAKILKRDVAAVVEEQRTPQIATIKPVSPSIVTRNPVKKQIQVPRPQVQAQKPRRSPPPVEASRPSAPPAAQASRQDLEVSQNRSAKKRPTAGNKIKPIPQANLMQAMTAYSTGGGMNITGDASESAGAISKAIGALVGGVQIHVDKSNPGDAV